MMTFEYCFDIQPGDVHFCTADIGWVTGHSYIVYGPLASGTTTVLFEGLPTVPDASRLWQVADDVQAQTLYTSPTALRTLMREGDAPVKKTSRASLRTLGTVGEPINPEVWRWYYEVVGEGRCDVVDTWWQTETGGVLIAPLPGAIDPKPGSATLPFFGIEPVLVDEDGKLLEGNDVNGNLCIAKPWPGQARTLYGDHRRFKETYFSRFPGLYFTGDGCRRDEDGYYWITGRVDDVLNVSGHRLGTAEVESALVAHEAVAEAAVVGMPHDLKGTGICAWVVLKADAEQLDRKELEGALKEQVRRAIGPIATPDVLHLVAGAAEDPQWQNHAPLVAKDCRRSARRLRRYDHPRRPLGRRAARFVSQPGTPERGPPMSDAIAPSTPEVASPQTLRTVIFASSLGTLFEWYDFYLYGSLASVFATMFYPKGNPTAAWLSTLATFRGGLRGAAVWRAGVRSAGRSDRPANIRF